MGGINRYWLGKKRPDMSGDRNPRWSRIHQIKCKECSKIFIITKCRLGKVKFCSHSCRAKFNFKGNKNPRWKGGNSNWRSQINGSIQYRKWRMSVFKRDRFTCKVCGYRSKKSKAHGDKTSDIQAHHIISVFENKKLSLKRNNGITLCIPCHRKTYGKEHLFAMEFKEILNDYMNNVPKG